MCHPDCPCFKSTMFVYSVHILPVAWNRDPFSVAPPDVD